MANNSINHFSCPLCQNLLKDPVTIPCGRSLCKKCINDYWDQEDVKNIYSCPQCRETFTLRPVLRRNKMLAEVVEKLKKIDLQTAHCYSGPGDVECDSCTGRKQKAIKSCLVCLVSFCEDHLQPHYQSPAFKKHKLVEACAELQEKICSEHDKLMEIFCRTDQSFICYLCMMEKHKGHDTVLAKTKPTVKQSFEVEQNCEEEFKQIRPQASAVKILLLGPKSREDFLQYFSYLTLDHNTAYPDLNLCEKNRSATRSGPPQRYSDHPDRFDSRTQVLCKESVCGQCYWEVEWSGDGVSISVSYKDISRKGRGHECLFGYNSKSWTLECSSSVSFRHDKIETVLRVPVSSRIGVFVDYNAGTLSFYGVSDTMRLLHTFQTTFTHPLYPGFWLWTSNSAVRLCDLK